MTSAHLMKIAVFLITAYLLSLAQSDPSRPIWFGTTLDAETVINDAKSFAAAHTDSTAATFQAKGDQRRTYHFDEASADEPYRVCVPESWDGKSPLPLVMFLHGAGNTESSYLDQNNKQMVKLANEHGFLLIAPLGDKGAYGNFLRLSAPFGNEQAATDLMAQVTTESERTNELSEKDVLQVLELVLHEYPVDRSALFLTGHSMGSGGAWYIGGKYASYWRALAPMSGPFVQEKGYPWDNVKQISFFVTEGLQTPSLQGSRAVYDWMKERDYVITYKEVDADHGGMVPLVLPAVFDFFENCRVTTPVHAAQRFTQPAARNENISSRYLPSHVLNLTFCQTQRTPYVTATVFDIRGRTFFSGIVPVTTGSISMPNLVLPPGIYHARITTTTSRKYVAFTVVR